MGRPATPPRAIVPRYVGTTITDAGMRVGPYCKLLALALKQENALLSSWQQPVGWVGQGRSQPSSYHHLPFFTIFINMTPTPWTQPQLLGRRQILISQTISSYCIPEFCELVAMVKVFRAWFFLVKWGKPATYYPVPVPTSDQSLCQSLLMTEICPLLLTIESLLPTECFFTLTKKSAVPVYIQCCILLYIYSHWDSPSLPISPGMRLKPHWLIHFQKSGFYKISKRFHNNILLQYCKVKKSNDPSSIFNLTVHVLHFKQFCTYIVCDK